MNFELDFLMRVIDIKLFPIFIRKDEHGCVDHIIQCTYTIVSYQLVLLILSLNVEIVIISKQENHTTIEISIGDDKLA